MDDADRPDLPDLAANLKIGSYTRHVLLCTHGDCSDPETAQASWTYLKKRIRQLRLDAVEGGAYRSKVDCLRICQDGPICVVYPDGVWYHHATPENLERILTEHVVGGKPVEELAFARNPIGPPAPGRSEGGE
jgi:(2Fe-2S) ferredoxin